MTDPKIYGVVGWKNSGKTGLMERLVAEFTARGLTVSTLKHTHHQVDLEVPGTDTHRHRTAGAQEVVLASTSRIAQLHELRGEPEPGIATLISRLHPCDLVLIEGFKSAPHPKVEASRAETGQPLFANNDATVRAVAANHTPKNGAVPVIDLDDTKAIADFIALDVGLMPDVPETPKANGLKNDCFALPPGVHWTPVEEALATLRDRLAPVTDVETVPTDAANGRILARDHMAVRSNPPGANSAVDGYAFAHATLPSGTPISVPLVDGRAAAGGPFHGTVPAGHAIRILTGALIPDGVDTVVMQEDVQIADGILTIPAAPKPGSNARAAGEDVAAGALALAHGHKLRAPDIALLSALGVAEVEAHTRLRVGVLSTGDELAAPGSTLDVARTYDANRPMLLSLAETWGYEPVNLGHVADDRAALAVAFDDGATRADVILTSGGASAGDEDHVSALLRDSGSLHHWRIAIKPGRPLALAQWNGTPVFGLPGNPVAALVTTLIFARPAFSVLAGGEWLEPLGLQLPAGFSKKKKAGRREYLRARIGADGRVQAFKSEGSGRISGLAWATGLVEMSDEAQEICEGDPVRFLPYTSFGLV
ncbi:bifunctional molybdopterin-guanine dinucleotide biosynthesis adaptor protein MobB/molybdopterin molybdotransferase MoeA [Aliiroseovarius lamellibrachiae]|uniref:bifunctional molybdopterin-guanine dinucleotide biosynthesis adaptor protein MobB/molybdopterin molybdotransferase MoeA n=1 Tax=Aliiroseovarius lamellibrachiae TaxID=1924933 RepID=UPI001BDF8374|nr:bifunctional molybdopterin-guanine dinucleotide biosynthesis adaptor protein MobB/molybdopterin molybdotransferase MoeA [Aliiroseovarius lamellibrachiae]MBT2131441.1 bifunctional molybdopterin-guanine dinucleotide biosynthesis adaptor protein MobB/molybdopterin molybdotransferase MoeA [Aliiroseovarius lamellibrachiae]